jgi:glycosyltransferase involved in cell wall biosynthesis
MKIVVASSGLGHVARGIETWAADLGRALVGRGVDAIVCKGAGKASEPWERVVPCWPRSSTKTERLLRWVPRKIGWRMSLGSGYEVEQMTFALRLIDLLRREQADILHVQDPQVALIVQRAARMGIIATRTILAHGTEEPPSFLNKITYLQHLAPWHMKEAGIARQTWTTIPNFVDTERFSPGRSNALRRELRIPGDATVVLCVAAIKRDHKRVDYLLDEFEHVRGNACLVIAGGREAQTDELIEQGQRRLGDRVQFLVRFPRERMPELYRMADVFTLCSLKEMMPIALLEATASGLPCIVNRHPVMEWMIGPGGLAIDISRPGSLADTLNRDQWRGLGERGRQHCVTHFSQETVVEQILEYYRFVLHQGRAAMRRAG